MSVCASVVALFFVDTEDAIVARLLARIFKRCADAYRPGEVDATITAVLVAGTNPTLEDDVVDRTDATVKREFAISKDNNLTILR